MLKVLYKNWIPLFQFLKSWIFKIFLDIIINSGTLFKITTSGATFLLQIKKKKKTSKTGKEMTTTVSAFMKILSTSATKFWTIKILRLGLQTLLHKMIIRKTTETELKERMVPSKDPCKIQWGNRYQLLLIIFIWFSWY